MLTIGDTFPPFSLTACVSLEDGKEFQTITASTYDGMWKVVFFWPLDFTFVCPTEIVDQGGTIRWVAVNDLNVGRNVDEVLRVLEALQTEKLTPCGWTPGEQTLN